MRCNHQPASLLPFSSVSVSTIPHLYLHHPYCSTSLPRLFCCFFHRPASLPLSRSLTTSPLHPTLPLLVRDATEYLGRRVPVGRAFSFRLGGRCCHSGRSTACHHIGPPMFRFWVPETPATVCVPVLGRHIFSLLGTAFFRNHISSRTYVHWPLLSHRDSSPELINLVPVRRIFISLLEII